MINIDLMTNTDPLNKVDKTISVSIAGSGLLKDDTNLITPSIIFEPGAQRNLMLRANYARLLIAPPSMYRYYFITSIENLTNLVYRINLKLDVLMTFADEIKALKCTVSRQENVRNGYLVDSEYNALCYKAYVTKAFPNAITADSLYLVTTG